MRTTIELPDELMTRAKVKAAQEGISLKDFFVSAVEGYLTSPSTAKRRRGLPVISTGGQAIRDLTREEIEDLTFPLSEGLE